MASEAKLALRQYFQHSCWIDVLRLCWIKNNETVHIEAPGTYTRPDTTLRDVNIRPLIYGCVDMNVTFGGQKLSEILRAILTRTFTQ